MSILLSDTNDERARSGFPFARKLRCVMRLFHSQIIRRVGAFHGNENASPGSPGAAGHQQRSFHWDIRIR